MDHASLTLLASEGSLSLSGGLAIICATESRNAWNRAQRLCVLAGRRQGGGVDQLMADEAIEAVADDDALVARPAHLAGETVELRVHSVFRLRCRSPVHVGFDHLQQQVGS